MTFAPRLAAAWVVASLVASVGCASHWVQTERRPDGIYHLKCKNTLQRCLDEAEAVCDRNRYVVLRAFDDHDYNGRTDIPGETRASEAFIRCGQRNVWGDLAKLRKEPLGEATAGKPSPAAPAAPAPACTPGATQACVGPGGCAGGQACLKDGSAFGPCDCGPAAAPAAPLPTTP